MIYRRQKKQYVFAGLLGVVAIVNILFFLILLFPARSEYLNLKDSISRLRTEVAVRKAKVAQSERRSAELDRFEQDRRDMFTTHFLKRESGYSEILPELEMMGQKAGVRNSRKDYSYETIPQYGMFSVKIKVPVQGGYPNVVNFIRELETSKTFYLINGIDVRTSDSKDKDKDASSASNGAGTLALALDLETFFYQ
jgi:hypothetical protein